MFDADKLELCQQLDDEVSKTKVRNDLYIVNNYKKKFNKRKDAEKKRSCCSCSNHDEEGDKERGIIVSLTSQMTIIILKRAGL